MRPQWFFHFSPDQPWKSNNFIQGISKAWKGVKILGRFSKKHDLFDVSAKLTCFIFLISSSSLWFTNLTFKQNLLLNFVLIFFSLLLSGSLLIIMIPYFDIWLLVQLDFIWSVKKNLQKLLDEIHKSMEQKCGIQIFRNTYISFCFNVFYLVLWLYNFNTTDHQRQGERKCVFKSKFIHFP